MNWIVYLYQGRHYEEMLLVARSSRNYELSDVPIFDGRERDYGPVPLIAQRAAGLAENVGRFVFPSVTRILFHDPHRQVADMDAVQVIKESDLD